MSDINQNYIAKLTEALEHSKESLTQVIADGKVGWVQEQALKKVTEALSMCKKIV